MKYKIFELLENWEWNEAQKQINEMLECLIHLYKNLLHFGSNISKGNAKKVIEKATGMKIEDILKE